MHETYEFLEKNNKSKTFSKRPELKQSLFTSILTMIDAGLKIVSQFKKLYSNTLISISEFANPFLSKILPKFEPIYLRLIRLFEPFLNKLSKKLISFIERADPKTFSAT